MTLEVDPSTARNAERPTSFLRRVLLRLMLVLVGAGVVVAIISVLRGEPLGLALSKVLYTAMGTGLYSLLALACADVAEKKPSLVAHSGIFFACAGVAVLFIGIWFEQARYPWWWKTFGITFLYALAFWRGARFTLSTVSGGARLVVQVTTLSCILIATLISAMIIHEEATMILVRIMNACWIVAIGGHVAIPILEKLQPPPPPPQDTPPST